jgi:hypothetical protein
MMMSPHSARAASICTPWSFICSNFKLLHLQHTALRSCTTRCVTSLNCQTNESRCLHSLCNFVNSACSTSCLGMHCALQAGFCLCEQDGPQICYRGKRAIQCRCLVNKIGAIATTSVSLYAHIVDACRQWTASCLASGSLSCHADLDLDLNLDQNAAP